MNKRLRVFAMMFVLMAAVLLPANVSAATRLEILKKNKTVTVYAVKSEVVRLKAISKCKWTSSRKNFATVRGSGAVGIVTSKAVGATTIKAVKGNIKYTCKYIVENPKISRTSLVLTKGRKQTLKISGTKQSIKWSSSNSAVCAVTTTGVVKAVKSGKAVITATLSGSKTKYRCTVTVKNPPVVYTDKWTVKNVFFDYYTDDDGEVEYDAVITIHNSGNTNLYLKDCDFDIYDSYGKLLYTETLVSTCRDVIKPGEDGYFYNAYTGTIKNADASTKLRLSYNPTIKRATGAPICYGVSNLSLVDGLFNTYSVIGHVNNNTSSEVSYLYIHSVFFDAYGKAIGVSGTSITDLAPNGYKSFEISTMFASKKVHDKEFQRYEVVAEGSYYQFD